MNKLIARMPLTNTVALITGGARMRKAIAVRFAERAKAQARSA